MLWYINYYYSKKEDEYYCGILIELKYRGKVYLKFELKFLCYYAKKHDTNELYDDFKPTEKVLKCLKI